MRPSHKLRVPRALVHTFDFLLAQSTAEEERVVQKYLPIVVVGEGVLEGAFDLAGFEFLGRNRLGQLAVVAGELDARFGSFVPMITSRMLKSKINEN